MSSGRIPHWCKAVCLEVCVVRLVLADQEIGYLLYSSWPVRFILCHSFSKVNLPIRKKKKKGLKKSKLYLFFPLTLTSHFSPQDLNTTKIYWERIGPKFSSKQAFPLSLSQCGAVTQNKVTSTAALPLTPSTEATEV